MAFKMKGNPMKRNFGVGASPTKQHNMEPESTASEGALASDVETSYERAYRGLGELGDVTDVLRNRKFRRDRLNQDKDGRKLTPGTAKKATSGAISNVAKKAAKKASPNKLGRVGVRGMGSGEDYTPEIVKKFYKKLGDKAESAAKGAYKAVTGKKYPEKKKKKKNPNVTYLGRF